MAIECALCDHLSTEHRRNGACFAPACLCGWAEDIDSKNNGVSLPYTRKKAFLEKGCYYCGGQARTVDHVIPRYRGGGSDCTNLVPACEPCNRFKRAMMPEEFLAHCKELVSMGTDFEKSQAQKILDWNISNAWVQQANKMPR